MEDLRNEVISTFGMDGRNNILKFLATQIFEDYTHKKVSALTKLAECQKWATAHSEHS